MMDSRLQKEGRMELAIKALNNDQIKSVRAAAKAYNVPPSTLKHRIRGRVSRVDSTPNCQNLTSIEESVLLNWIISADERGLPPQYSTVRHMASILSQKQIGVNWVNRFIQRHDEVKARYSRRYDHQRALCEDPKIIQGWFNLVHNIIAKYGILEQDIYNFDETGFSMGMTSTSKVCLYQFFFFFCLLPVLIYNSLFFRSLPLKLQAAQKLYNQEIEIG